MGRMRPSEKLPAVYKHDLKSVVLVGIEWGHPTSPLGGAAWWDGVSWGGPRHSRIVVPRKEQKL